MEIADRLPPLTSLLAAPEHAAPDLPRESFEPLRRRVAGLLKKGGKIQKGKPRIVILCISGLRCIEVMKNIKDLKGEAQVAKVSFVLVSNPMVERGTPKLMIIAIREAYQSS